MRKIEKHLKEQRKRLGFVRINGWLQFFILIQVFVFITLIAYSVQGGTMLEGKILDKNAIILLSSALLVVFLYLVKIRFRYFKEFNIAINLLIIASAYYALTIEDFLVGLLFYGGIIAYLLLSKRVKHTFNAIEE